MRETAQEVKDFLDSVYEARTQMARCRARLRRLGEEEMPLKVEQLPGGAVGEQAAACLGLLGAELGEMSRGIRVWREREREVAEFIDRIPDSRCRAVLRLRYLDLLGWNQVQTRLEECGIYYDLRHIYRLHTRGLAMAEELWRKKKEDL